MNPSEKTYHLQTESLSIGYPDLLVAEDIQLQTSPGKLICILGKNASGKSTLLRSLSKLQEALHGNILINAKNIKEYDAVSLAKIISLVLTDTIPDNLFSVYDFIALGRQVHTNWIGKLTATDKERIDFAIRQTHIEAFVSKSFSSLSDGQKQKVLIAKAIAQDTPIILLDEPTAHLDVHHSVATYLLLQELAHKYHKTIVMASHEIGLAAQFSDILWLVNETKIINGKTKSLVNNGIINKIFDSELIRFNPKTSTFDPQIKQMH